MAEPDDPMGQQVKRFGKGEVHPQDFLSDDGMMHRIGVEILPEQLPVADDFALQSAVAGRICRTDRPCEICQSVFRIGFGQIFGIGDPEPFGQHLLFGQYRHSGAKWFRRRAAAAAKATFRRGRPDNGNRYPNAE